MTVKKRHPFKEQTNAPTTASEPSFFECRVDSFISFHLISSHLISFHVVYASFAPQGGLVAFTLRSDLFDSWMPAMVALESAGIWRRLRCGAEELHPYVPSLDDAAADRHSPSFLFSIHCFHVQRSFEFAR